MGGRKSGEGGSRIYLGILVAGLAVLAAVAAYVQLAPAKRVPPEMRRPEAGRPGPAREVQVPQPRFEDGELKFDSKSLMTKPGEDPAVAALNGFLRASRIAPQEARCVAVRREGDVAVLDFSAPFAQTYGSEDEQALLAGIAKTLRQFPGIQRFRLAVDGKPLDSLGNIDLSEPLALSDF
ncbi:MAG: GerMN domain-containing protein [Fimbriimonadales bacterium]|nr:GerMN domain-containing protein [Fimbriimonadales bacterium]